MSSKHSPASGSGLIKPRANDAKIAADLSQTFTQKGFMKIKYDSGRPLALVSATSGCVHFDGD
jgi:hypothetical protein